MHIKDLTADPANRRTHNPRNVGMIVDALHKVGAARSIVIDEDNVILAGNGVTEAAAEAGITKVQVVDADGETLVAVRRTGLTDDQKRALAIYDNRTAELAEWNLDQLQKDAEAGLDLSTFFRDDELKALLRQVNTKDGLTDPDDVPPERPTDIKLGDLFALGNHRLLCGDSTKAEDVALVMDGEKAALMVTDPPYGVSYADKNKFLNAIGRGNCIEEPIAADHQKPEEMAAFWALAFGACRPFLSDGSAYYVTGPQVGMLLLLLLQTLDRVGYPLRHMLIWAKQQFVIGRSDYHYQHEPIIYGWVKGSHTFFGGRGESSLWQIDKPHQSKLHPTMKPVELYERAIRNSSDREARVLEPFSGSGTSLVACETLGRRCRAIELDPKYVQVAIDRWEAFTGQKAVKVTDGR